ncbi:MAG TPA: universal stress protein [Candidatus Thermoplasmatota archaeon]|jgi:nucleotide-binding universal stress UspA family protein|nr:universal stress protein [Candidatus Thermoplasmatota archaeon]
MMRKTPELDAAAAELHEEADRLSREVDRLTLGAWKLEPSGQAGSAGAPLGFRRILLAVDGSDGASRAFAWVERLAPAFKAHVAVATVVPPATVMDSYASQFLPTAGMAAGALLQEEEARAEQLVAGLAARLEGQGVDASHTVLIGSPAAELLKLAEREHADLVVVGAHGGGAVERALLGSVADAVKNHAHASVLLARNHPPARRVLVPVDGSRASKRAAAVALRLARAWDAPVSFLHVLAPVAAVPENAMQASLRAALGGVDVTWVRPRASAAIEIGKPAERILAAALQEEANFIVMGSRGLSGLRSLVAGSVSNRVAHQAQASVLLVKEAGS